MPLKPTDLHTNDRFIAIQKAHYTQWGYIRARPARDNPMTCKTSGRAYITAKDNAGEPRKFNSTDWEFER
jgi:hypothetical protein